MDVSSIPPRAQSDSKGSKRLNATLPKALSHGSHHKDKDGQRMLTDAGFDAGEKLRADFWFAQ